MSTKTQPKPATYTKLRADKMKHAGEMPSPDGESTVYVVNFVTEGTLHTYPCSQAVFNKIHSQKYAYEKSLEFTLGLNKQTKIIERIDATQKKDFFHERGGLPDDAVAAAAGGDVNFVLFVLESDGTVDCKAQPSNCTTETVNIIRDAIEKQIQGGDPVRMNDLLEGKYFVTDTRQGGNHIYVDPKIR